MEILKWCNAACQPRNLSFCHSLFVALKITLFKSVIFSFLCFLSSTCCSRSNFYFPIGLRVLLLLENATVLSGWRRQDRLCVRSQVCGCVEKVRQRFLSLLDHSQLNSWCCLGMLQAVCFHNVLVFSSKKETKNRKVSQKHGRCPFTVFEWSIHVHL